MKRFFQTPLLSCLLLLSLAAVGACALIDEQRNDCPEEMTLTCSLNLVNNKEQEMDENLGTLHDRPLREALEDYLSNVFISDAHDVELLFYDQRNRGKRTFRQKEVMDAEQKVFTVRVPASDYRVAGISNLSAVPMVSLQNETVSSAVSLVQKLSGKVSSHPSAVFTSRQRILVRDKDDQNFEMHFYMANAAAALLLNRDSSEVKSIRAEYIGLADTYKVVDSAYAFNQHAVVKADNIDVVPFEKVGGNEEDASLEAEPFIYNSFWEMWTKTPLMVCGVGFPSPNVSSEVIGIYPKIWTIDLYVTLSDDSVTRNQIYIGRPLVAGSLMIIKGWICADGSFSPRPEHEPFNPGPGGPDDPPEPPSDSTVVGVTVMINWTENPGQNPKL